MLTLAAAEFLLVGLAVHVAAFVRFSGDLPGETEGFLLWIRSAVFAAAVVTAMTCVGLYQLRQRLEVEGVMIRVALALLLAAVGLALLYYTIPTLQLGRGWLALSFAFALAFLIGS